MLPTMVSSVSLLTHLVFGGAFLVAGWLKMSSPTPFADTVARLTGMSGARSSALARILPLSEVLLGALVVLGIGSQWAAGAGVLTLGAFSVTLLRALRRGVTESCGCFGSVADNPLSFRDLGRNGVLAALGILAAATAKDYPVGFGNALADLTTPQRLVGVAALACAVLVAWVAAEARAALFVLSEARRTP